MAEIRWTEEADRWLRDIHDYIAADNPDSAQKVVAGIHEKAQVLQRCPKSDTSIATKKTATSESCSTDIIELRIS